MVTNCGPVSKKPQRSQIRLELAVEVDWSGAMPVAQQAAVVGASRRMFGPSTSLDSTGARRYPGFDGFGDAEVLVGDGAVGDPRVRESHAHGPMPQQRRVRLRDSCPG